MDVTTSIFWPKLNVDMLHFDIAVTFDLLVTLQLIGGYSLTAKTGLDQHFNVTFFLSLDNHFDPGSDVEISCMPNAAQLQKLQV